MTVTEILKAAGGREVIARHISRTVWALDKWPRKGIPQKYWQDIIDLSGGKVTLQSIFEANQEAKASATHGDESNGQAA